MKTILSIILAFTLIACQENTSSVNPSTTPHQNPFNGSGSTINPSLNPTMTPEEFTDSEENLAQSQLKKVDLIFDEQTLDPALPLSLCLDEIKSLYLRVEDDQFSVDIVQKTYHQKEIRWFVFGPEIISLEEAGIVTAKTVGMTYLIVLHPEFGRRYLVRVYGCNPPAEEEVPELPVEEEVPVEENPVEEVPLPEEPVKTVADFRVSPQLYIVGETNIQNLKFYKIYDDGSEEELNATEKNTLNFMSSDADIAQSNFDGELAGNQNGCAKIVATWGNYSSFVFVSRGLAALIPKNDPFADRVVCFIPGPGAGFGMNGFPDNILSGPKGKGANQGTLDVVSLGTAGEMILETETPVQNGAGEDFIVFENSFQIGGNPNSIFAELGIVSASENGESFAAFDCDDEDEDNLYPGCAGVGPSLANVDTNQISPTDPAVAGGDAYDLSDIGLSSARYILITDHQNGGGGGAAGMDLDAVSFRY